MSIINRLISFVILSLVYSVIVVMPANAVSHQIQLVTMYIDGQSTITRFGGVPSDPHGNCTSILFKDAVQVATGGDFYPYLCNEHQMFPNYPLTPGVYSVIMTDGWGETFTTDNYQYPPLTPTNTPTPTEVPSPTLTPLPTAVITSPPTPTQAPKKITTFSPAKIWLSLRNPTDLTVRVDLRAEVYEGTTLIASGQSNSIPLKMSLFGFKKAQLVSIPFDQFSPVAAPAGSELRFKLLVRNACIGSLRNAGVARLWFNDKDANSKLVATIDKKKQEFFLRDNLLLSQAKGSVMKTIDIDAGARCSDFKSFGTWVGKL